MSGATSRTGAFAVPPAAFEPVKELLGRYQMRIGTPVDTLSYSSRDELLLEVRRRIEELLERPDRAP